MSKGLDRRRLLTGGIVAGTALALPRAVRAATEVPAPPAPADLPVASPLVTQAPAPIAAPPFDLAGYHKKVLGLAAQHKERVAAKLWRTDIVGIADFARPSWEPRFHFANLENGTVRSFLMAHGKGSDIEHDGWLKNFSNVPGSEATSRGAFLTCEWYTGKYGTSIRLVGLDPDNSLALERMIVMHAAWYVDQAMIQKWGKIGRSSGCFAMGNTDFNEALIHLSGGRLLFADRIDFT